MEFLAFALNAIAIVVLVDAVASWFVGDETEFPRNVTAPLTEPLYGPIRAILKPEMTGGLDFAPMVVILVCHTLARALVGQGSFVM